MNSEQLCYLCTAFWYIALIHYIWCILGPECNKAQEEKRRHQEGWTVPSGHFPPSSSLLWLPSSRNPPCNNCTLRGNQLEECIDCTLYEVYHTMGLLKSCNAIVSYYLGWYVHNNKYKAKSVHSGTCLWKRKTVSGCDMQLTTHQCTAEVFLIWPTKVVSLMWRVCKRWGNIGSPHDQRGWSISWIGVVGLLTVVWGSTRHWLVTQSMYVCTSMSMYIYTYVCTYVCMYVCTSYILVEKFTWIIGVWDWSQRFWERKKRLCQLAI